MRVKLAAKLLLIGWALMKKKEPFNQIIFWPNKSALRFDERVRNETWRPI
jgi:hypothetical protein